jgi:Tol biopolymer transport system component
MFTPEQAWGRGEEVTVRLLPGARSTLGLAIQEEIDWSFTVSRVLLAYLWPADGAADIYALDAISGETQQWTFGADVQGFDASADGTKIYYSSGNDEGGSDLRLFDRASGADSLLLACGRDSCTGPAVSPEGARLAFERLAADLNAVSEVWLLPLGGSQAERVSAILHISRAPSWSPAGQLAYYDEGERAFIVLDVDSGEEAVIPNVLGDAYAWLPGGGELPGEGLAAPEAVEVELSTLRGPTGEAEFSEPGEEELAPVEAVASYLFAYENGGEGIDLSRNTLVEDASPAFSPNGRWLAFARKYIDAQRWTPGRQLWLMLPDGSEQQPLTNDGDFNHTSFAWHPDSGQLAYVRFNQTALTRPPELWIIDILDGETIQLVINAYGPQWVP